MPSDIADRLLFVVGAPRSGTTLLMRMLNAHPDILSRPEPHLLTPLARLGYYGRVQAAPYDVFQTQSSIRKLVADLPNGEEDYLDALRAYTDTIYGRLLEPSGKRYFVDKTPAYALELPFVTRLYPRAKYLVLTRHPFAIFASYAASFFDDDWDAAHRHNPLLERYLPAMARFLRESPVPHVHLRYEALVADPEAHMQDVCAYLDLPFTASMIEYGKTQVEGQGLGDPIGVDAHDRPVTRSVEKWTLAVKGRADRIDLLKRALDLVPDEDLATLGFSRDDLWTPLEGVDVASAESARAAGRKWDRYHLERRALVTLRANIHRNALGRLLRTTRDVSEILLRDPWTPGVDEEGR
ncbi:MAG: sulfotransferase [Alphaproteobacteria bacterium]|nr:sulfotransferase [Alphaproteobacteria bacterium]MCB9692684.1 sulfotransferase [Alphaproteobacteria bacterium]